MYQEKEFLKALMMLPDDKLLIQLHDKYSGIILFQIANRCVEDGYINKNNVSFGLFDDGQHLTIKYSEPRLTEAGNQFLAE